MAGFELLDAVDHRVRRGDVFVGQIFVERKQVNVAADRRMAEQRFQFRSEQKRRRIQRPIERLFAEPVARQKEPLLRAIPDRKREHAVQFLQHLFAVLFVKMDQNFGVGVRVKLMPRLFEFLAQGAIIVNFAVEDDPAG